MDKLSNSEFERWVLGTHRVHGPGIEIQLNQFLKDGAQRANAGAKGYQEFIDRINSHKDQYTRIDFYSSGQYGTAIHHDFEGVKAHSFQVRGVKNFRIKNLETFSLSIENEAPTYVQLTSCRIAELRVNVDCRSNLVLINCQIGTLNIQKNSVTDLKIDGCEISDVKCPIPEQDNPILGSVVVTKNSWFATQAGDNHVFSGPQSYTSMRAHLEKLQNAPMAGRFRALELAAERQSDTGLTWFSNILYGATANYGLSPARPLLIALVLYAVFVVGVYSFDGGVRGMPEDRYQGYLSVLAQECSDPSSTDKDAKLCIPRLARSAFLPFQSIGGPIVFFSANKLVVAQKPFTVLLLGIQGLFTDIMIFLSIISIRRRFKLN